MPVPPPQRAVDPQMEEDPLRAGAQPEHGPRDVPEPAEEHDRSELREAGGDLPAVGFGAEEVLVWEVWLWECGVTQDSAVSS